MSITSISRDWGVNPSIVRMVSTDTLATIGTSGYLLAQADNIATINNGAFEWNITDMVLVYASDGWDFFTIDPDFESLNIFVPAGVLTSTLTNTHIFVGNASNIATDVAMSGDATLANTGVLTIANGAITNAKVSASAAIDFSKLATLTSGNILVGSAGNVATSVAMSGDATIDNTGVLTIGTNAITSGKILDANVTLSKLAAGITPSHIVKFAGQPTTVGGAPAEVIAVVGALSTDLAFVQIVNNGAANVTVLEAVVTNDTLTVTFSADPSNDVVINYQLLRAAA